MSEFDDMPPDEQKALHAEAMMLYQAVQVQLLEEVLGLVCKELGATICGKDVRTFLHEKRDDAFRDLLRALADTDPARASKLSRFFEAMKRGDFR